MCTLYPVVVLYFLCRICSLGSFNGVLACEKIEAPAANHCTNHYNNDSVTARLDFLPEGLFYMCPQSARPVSLEPIVAMRVLAGNQEPIRVRYASLDLRDE